MTEINDKTLSVRLYGKEIGILSQNKGGKMEFRYTATPLFPISKSLPFSDKVFKEKQCRPFFNGLLPESELTRKRIARIFGINPNNDFSLLKAIGHDCAGALSLHTAEEPVIEEEFIIISSDKQTESSLAQYIEDLPTRPFFTSAENDIRLSLAGVQDKAAVIYMNGEIGFPKQHTPTTHILKPEIKNLESTIANEYFCMCLAASVGINVPKVEIRKAGNIKYLLIERYDRIIRDNYVKRIHQEDFCQALGVLSLNKYQKDGGPGIKKSFELISSSDYPAKNKSMFIKLILFNFLIGNNDAHGKNLSLLYNSAKASLAPAYDLLSTEVYPRLSKDMAMKIGSYDKDRISYYDWEKMCREADYSFSIFKREAFSLSEKLFSNATSKTFGLNGNDIAMAKKIADVVSVNKDKLQRCLKQ